jgi:large subunit ribosomal protein L23
MALFGKKQEKRVEEAAQSEGVTRSLHKKVQEKQAALPTNVSAVLLRPRITEKATDASARGVYVFDVSLRSTKQQIREAVHSVYKVTPKKIRIVKKPVKNVRNPRTGVSGVKGGGKKAYVYLKEGETISVM